jgi:hypothetical protein
MQSQHIDQITAAIAAVQAVMPVVVADSENPFFKSSYADLSGIWKTIRDCLAENKVAVIQGVFNPHIEGGFSTLRTRLAHASGQYIEDDGVPLILEKQTMQQMGSAITYARRQGLTAMVGVSIAGEDDDANEASNTALPQRTEAKPKMKKMKGPHNTMTALKKASKEFAADVAACEDIDALTAFENSKPSKQLMEQLKEDWPAAYDHPPVDGEDWRGAVQLLADRREQLGG